MPDARTRRTRNEPRRVDLDRKCDPRTPRPPLDAAERDLVGENLGLAYAVAKPFRQSTPGLADDIDSTALVALCEAAKEWNPSEGAPFASFAWAWIEGTLKKLVEKERRNGFVGGKDAPAVSRLREDLAEESAGDDEEPSAPSESFEELIVPLPEAGRAACRAVFVDGLSQRAAARSLGVPKTSFRRELLASIATLRATPRADLDHPGHCSCGPDAGEQGDGRSTGDEGRDGNVGCGGPCEACGVPDPVCGRGGASGRARVDRPGRRCG